MFVYFHADCIIFLSVQYNGNHAAHHGQQWTSKDGCLKL